MEIKRRREGCSQLTEGHPQQQGGRQQDGAGGQGPGAVVVPVAAALVGPIAVVSGAALHLGPGRGAIGLFTEALVRA